MCYVWTLFLALYKQVANSRYANVGLNISSVTLADSIIPTVSAASTVLVTSVFSISLTVSTASMVSVTATVSVPSDDSLSAGEITGMVIGIVMGMMLFIIIALISFCL